MRVFFRRCIGIFAVIWACLIFGYVFLIAFAETSVQDSVHEKIAPLSLFSGFLGVRDFPDWKNNSEEINSSVLANLRKLREKNSGDDILFFDIEGESLDLFSPFHVFVGEVLTGAAEFDLVFEHKDLDERLEINLMPFVDDMGVWKFEVGLHNDLMKLGKNTYYFEITSVSGEKKKYKKRLNVDFETIDLNGVELYLDPYFVKDGHKLVRKEDDFDGLSTHFMTVGCSSEEKNVLIKQDYSYDFIPSCLTYSLKKNYLVYFSDMIKRTREHAYTYTATSVKQGVVYDHFPLFQWKLGSLYQSLLFFNPEGKFLQILKAVGDDTEFETLIQHYDIRTKKNTMGLRQVNGDQVEIENGYEKMIVYFFKDNNTKRSVSFPGLRFKYYVMRSGRRKLINQGTLYHLEEKISVMPDAEYGSSIRLGSWLHENKVIIEDSFKHVTFDIGSLSKPMSVVDKPIGKVECSQMEAGIYGFLGDKRDYLYEQDNINILGKGRHVDRVSITDNYGSMYETEQLFQGYLSSVIEPNERGVMTGDVVFTIEGFDKNDRKICTKEVSISLNEDPFK